MRTWRVEQICKGFFWLGDERILGCCERDPMPENDGGTVEPVGKMRGALMAAICLVG